MLKLIKLSDEVSETNPNEKSDVWICKNCLHLAQVVHNNKHHWKGFHFTWTQTRKGDDLDIWLQDTTTGICYSNHTAKRRNKTNCYVPEDAKKQIYDWIDKKRK